MKPITQMWTGLLAVGSLSVTTALAAFVTDYGAVKVAGFEQTGPAPANPPVSVGHTFYSFAVQTEPDALLFGTVSAGGPLPAFLGPSFDDPLLLEADSEYASQAALDDAFPDGTFTFQFLSGEGDQLEAAISLAGAAYPPAPAVKNFSAAQDINAAQSFTLEWDTPAEIGAADFVIVEIEADSEPLLNSPLPWQPGALSGTTTSFTIPAGVLPADSDIQGKLTFVKITAINTTDIADATGVAGYGTLTSFPLALHGSGGGDDTTPPVLVFTQPMSGATGVAANAAVRFTFSEAMQPQQFVTWTGVPSPASFSYSWSVDGTTLVCTYPGGFPSGAVVTWQLNPASFVDLAGNPLLAVIPGQLTGTFTVGGDGECSDALENRTDSFFLSRFSRYMQTSPGAPELDVPGDEGSPASFYAFFSPQNLNPSAAEFSLPGGQNQPLMNQFGMFFFQQGFTTETALEAAYPAGNYTTRLTVDGSASSLAINLGDAPTTPHCSNYDAAQAVNPLVDFTLTWDAFTGADNNDRVELVIQSEQGTEIFRRPMECANPPLPLSPTATSLVIPANTLQPGRTYDAELSFYRITDLKESTSPAYTALGGYARTTRFTVKTTGTSGQPPVITGYRVAADQHFEVDVTASVGAQLTLNATTDYVIWTPVGNAAVPASGQVTLRDSRVVAPGLQAYRVSSN